MQAMSSDLSLSPNSSPDVSDLTAAPAMPAPLGTHDCPRWDSRTLLGQAAQAEIQHGDQVYRLRLTALGKLILTK